METYLANHAGRQCEARVAFLLFEALLGSTALDVGLATDYCHDCRQEFRQGHQIYVPRIFLFSESHE